MLLGGLLWLWLVIDWDAILPDKQSIIRITALAVGAWLAWKLGHFIWLKRLKNYHVQMRTLKDMRGKGSLSHGSADFANTADLKKAGMLGDSGLVIGKFNNRFLRFDKPGHLITFAPTRSGKGVGQVIPNLLTHKGSVVVNDIKGENYAVTGRFRSQFSKVYTFAPFAEKSDCFNPIDFIRVNTPDELDDAKVVADMLILEDNASDPFWSREARNLIEGLLLYVAHESPPPLRNLSEVRYLIMQTKKDFELMIEDMLRCKNAYIKRVAASITATEPKVLASVLSTAKSQTAVWDSPKLAKITSRSDFKLEDIKREIISLYIVIPPENLSVYAPIVRLMIGMAVKAMTRSQGQPKERVLFLIDEFPALRYMQPIEEGVGFLAGYGINLWMFIQDLSQIKDLYERWATFISNCAVRVAFGTNDVETAKTLSDMLGTTTITVRGEGTQESLNLTDKMNPLKMLKGGTKNINMSDTGRALMTPDEVMRLPYDSQLIFIQGAKPVVAEKIFYFQDPAFKGLFDKWNG